MSDLHQELRDARRPRRGDLPGIIMIGILCLTCAGILASEAARSNRDGGYLTRTEAEKRKRERLISAGPVSGKVTTWTKAGRCYAEADINGFKFNYAHAFWSDYKTMFGSAAYMVEKSIEEAVSLGGPDCKEMVELGEMVKAAIRPKP